MNETLKATLLPVRVTPGAVLYNKAQNLTEEQRARARANIGVTGQGAVLPPSESIRAIVEQLFKNEEVTNELFEEFVEWLFAGDEVTENFYNEFISNLYSKEEIANKFFEEFITELFEGGHVTEEFTTKLTEVLEGDEYFIQKITQNVAEQIPTPIATADSPGVIRVGPGLMIDADGVLSVVGGGGSDLPDGDGVEY